MPRLPYHTPLMVPPTRCRESSSCTCLLRTWWNCDSSSSPSLLRTLSSVAIPTTRLPRGTNGRQFVGLRPEGAPWSTPSRHAATGWGRCTWGLGRPPWVSRSLSWSLCLYTTCVQLPQCACIIILCAFVVLRMCLVSLVEDGEMSYRVLWLPQRYPFLASYCLFGAAIVSLIFLITARTRRQTYFSSCPVVFPS